MPETYIPFVAPAGGEGPILYQKSPAVRKRLKRGLPCYPAVLAEEVGKAGGQGALAQGSCLALCAALRERGVKADLVYIDPPLCLRGRLQRPDPPPPRPRPKPPSGGQLRPQVLRRHLGPGGIPGLDV